MPPSNTAYVLEATRRYLREQHAQDPRRYPAEIKAIAAAIDVARGSFYKTDPEIVALVKEIEDAHGKAKQHALPLAMTIPDGAGPAGVATAELEREIGEGLAGAVWQMKGFVSLIERSDSVAEAPLHMAELDARLRRIGAIYRDLEAPYRAWKDRKKREAGEAAPLSNETPDSDVLDLDFSPPEE